MNYLLPEVLQTDFNDLEALIYNWLGNSYWLKGNLNESLKFHKLALSLRKKFGISVEIATSLNNIAIIYRIQGRLKQSIEMYNEALSFKLNSMKGDSAFLINRGLSYFELEKFEIALEDQIKACKLRKTSGSKSLLADSQFNVIRSAYSLKNTRLLLEFIEKFNSISDIASVKSIKLMAEDYLKMIDNPTSAIENWSTASLDNSLEFGYKIICYKEMISINVSNNNSIRPEELFSFIDEFELLATKNNLFSSLVKINFIRGIIFKDLFEMDRAKLYLQKSIDLSMIHGLPYQENLARKEFLNIQEKMETFEKLYKNEEKFEPVIEPLAMLPYIQNLNFILSESFEE